MQFLELLFLPPGLHDHFLVICFSSVLLTLFSSYWLAHFFKCNSLRETASLLLHIIVSVFCYFQFPPDHGTPNSAGPHSISHFEFWRKGTWLTQHLSLCQAVLEALDYSRYWLPLGQILPVVQAAIPWDERLDQNEAHWLLSHQGDRNNAGMSYVSCKVDSTSLFLLQTHNLSKPKFNVRFCFVFPVWLAC